MSLRSFFLKRFLNAEHSRHTTWVCLVLVLGVGCGVSLLFAAEEPTKQADASAEPEAKTASAGLARKEAFFQRRVFPLLVEKCFACHADKPDDLQGELDLRTRETAQRGGASGEPGIVPGEPEKSLIYRAAAREIVGVEMPPKENDRLTADQLEILRRWIADGAIWSDKKPAETSSVEEKQEGNEDAGVEVLTTGGRTEQWTHRVYRPEDLWAYRPIRRVEVPKVAGNASQPLHPIDAFLLEKVLAQGVDGFAPAADKRTLARRVTIDLTGLPPKPEEVEQILKDESPQAYEKLVDRLLSLPQYGEQMARHWLDVVRYADTSGFSNDFERPHAWRYRDYVIRSLNQDKPFDRFIVEQLAGDELDPADPELAIAVGFLRMGPWEHTAMTVAAVTRQQYLDDVTHHVGVTLLGQGLRCASCHDHKFDPVPTADYYRLQAVFAPVQFAERPLPFLQTENISRFAEGKAFVQKRLDKTKQVLGEIEKKNQQAVEAYLREKGVKKFEDLPADDTTRRDNLGLSYEELSIRKVYQKRQQYFERELSRFDPHCFSLYSGPPNNYTSVKTLNPIPQQRQGAVPAVYVLTGGSLASPQEEVFPGVLSAVAGSNSLVDPNAFNTIPTETEGRRLALARWIASDNNTLTARVIVNRVWQWHFGQGLVATPNNFGRMGARPTHPELLDWLATWFMDHDWSLKKLHRLILTSAAYRQSSEHPRGEELRQKDPNNQWLAYFPARRLAAEEIRDGMLAASEELNLDRGGPGTFPEINWEVAFQPRHIMGSVAPAYQPSKTPAERNRRTIYTFRIRTLSDPMLEVLNRPGSETSCERRDETTVVPQTLALFNGEFTQHRALALAARLVKEFPEPRQQVEEAFRRVYYRLPEGEEQSEALAHVESMLEYHRQHTLQPIELPRTVRRQMVEEMTGQEVSWDEELEFVEDYQRDLMPWEASPEVRALAELCLVLFNSNEFLYLR